MSSKIKEVKHTAKLEKRIGMNFQYFYKILII